jgi:quercetin dioxygenase-like cupin family protein
MSLRIRKLAEEPGEQVTEEGFRGVNNVWVVKKREEMGPFSSRIFRIEPGGHTDLHAHDREHIAVVIRGICRVEGGGSIEDVREGSIVSVGKGVSHRFINSGQGKLALLIMNFFEVSPGSPVAPS